MTKCEQGDVIELPLISPYIELSEEIQHYVCCDISDNFCGLTTTFCGIQVFEDMSASKENPSMCIHCVEIAKRPGCPLGHECEPED